MVVACVAPTNIDTTAGQLFLLTLDVQLAVGSDPSHFAPEILGNRGEIHANLHACS